MNRAYLAVDEVSDVQGRVILYKNGKLNTLGCLKNYGTVPAHGITIRATINKGEAPDMDGALAKPPKAAGELYPSQERTLLLRSPDIEAEGSMLSEEGENFYVCGRIDYMSGTLECHTDFCFIINGASWYHVAAFSGADWLP